MCAEKKGSRLIRNGKPSILKTKTLMCNMLQYESNSFEINFLLLYVHADSFLSILFATENSSECSFLLQVDLWLKEVILLSLHDNSAAVTAAKVY